MNVQTNGAVAAFRTSGLKDWYAADGGGAGTTQYVNQMYAFTNVAGGWQAVSANSLR